MASKRPLGLTIIMIYYLFSLIVIPLMGFLSLIIAKSHIAYVLWFKVEGIEWIFLLRILFFAVTLSIVYGIWKRKQYTPHVIYAYAGYGILTYIVYLGLILFSPSTYFSIVQQTANMEEGVLAVMMVFSIMTSMTKILIYSVIIWYVHKKELFFKPQK